MEMQFKNEIKKLADVVVWADSKIRDGGYNEEKYNNDGATAYCHVKANELWRIRDVALETMERQTVYTNALNKDIADKAAKIELLEKEIEGRKEGYTALKELMDTKYIPIDEHDDVCKAYEKKVAELEKQNEYLTKELEKTYAEKEADLKNHNRRDMNLVDELAGKNEKIKSLVQEIEKLKVDLIHEREKNEKLARAHAELENDMRKRCKDVISQSKTICNLKKELDICGHEVRFYKDRMNTLYEEKIEKEDDHGRAGFKKYIEWLVKEEETKFKESWKARLNEELEAIFKEKEETEVKGVGRTSSGRYPWGAKVNDIPCGEDAIE